MINRCLFIMIFLFNICAVASSFPLKVKDDLDRFSTSPQRIISLVPSITEQLYLLGVEDKLIGCTVYCQRPPEAKKKEKVGTVIEVNLEKIVSLKPDLVLATSLTNLKATKKLKSIGINLVSFPPPKNFSEICRQFLKLAKLVGKEKEAGEIIIRVKERADSIKKNVKFCKGPKVFVQIGARPLFTVTKHSFINDLIRFAGGINIAGEIEAGYYNREEVLKSNPDVIIIVTMGVVGEEEKKIWQDFETLNAAKLNRIYIIDSDKICSPTPVNFVKALEEITRILHPISTSIGN